MTLFLSSLFTSAVLLFAATANGGMYSEHVTALTSANFDALVLKSSETWLVKFYAPWCGHCKASAPAFSKAAKKLLGVARLGAVNCDEERDIAQRYNVQGFPAFKIFKGDNPRARRPSEYNSERSSNAFVEHVKYVMPSYVARVKPTGLDAFFNDLSSLPHVLLFTAQSSTSPLYKGMSARFKDRIAFGEVRQSDAAELLNQFSVTKFPTLLAFDASNTTSESAVHYSGDMDPSSLDSFFQKIVDENASAAGSGMSSNADDTSKKVFAQPKAYSGDVVLIEGTRAYEESCGARKDGRMCALAFLHGGSLAGNSYELLKPIALKYQYDNMAFAVMDGTVSEAKEFASAFGVSSDSGLVVIRARKDKFSVMDGKIEETTVPAFLDKIVGGDARWQKLKGTLPTWESENNDTVNASTETSDDESETGDSGQCNPPPEDGGSGTCS